MSGFWRCVVGVSAVLSGVALVGGCGADASAPGGSEPVNVDVPGVTDPSKTETPARAGSGSVDGPQEMGYWRGHWDGRKLSFTPIDKTALMSGIRPQAFVQLNESKLEVWTNKAYAVNAGCPDNIDPANDYYATRQLFGGTYANGAAGGYCENGQLCSLLEIDNKSGRNIDKIYLEILSITGGGHADFAHTSPVPPTYNVMSATNGVWAFGDIPNGEGHEVRVDFTLTSCADLYFDARVMGTLAPSSFGVSGDDEFPLSNFLDACDLGGTPVTPNPTYPPAESAGLPLNFPFSLYGYTFDGTAAKSTLFISQYGALSLGPTVTSVGEAFDLHDYSIYAFWDNLALGAGQVCYLPRGTTPGSRQFVVTWKNLDILNGAGAVQGQTTFSAVLNEGTDNVLLQYATCGTNPSVRGGTALVGLRGEGAQTAAWRQNTVFIPQFCNPGLGYQVTFTGTGNTP